MSDAYDKEMQARLDEGRVCTCAALNHDHAPDQCAEPPAIRGGVCTSCRLWFQHHDRIARGES